MAKRRRFLSAAAQCTKHEPDELSDQHERHDDEAEDSDHEQYGDPQKCDAGVGQHGLSRLSHGRRRRSAEDADTVVRAGIGMFNGTYTNRSNGIPATGFNTNVAFATGDNGINPAFNWDNGFPQDFELPPNFSPFQLNGQNARAVIRDDYNRGCPIVRRK